MPATITPGGTRGTLYAAIARARLDDAVCLVKGRRAEGAIYLAGYAIECSLKEAVCIRTGRNYLPVSEEVHSWDRLVQSAHLWPAIKAQPKVFSLYSSLAEKWRSFKWGPGLRYRTGLFGRREAERLYSEVSELYYSLIEMIQ
jgi:hypothetical protein